MDVIRPSSDLRNHYAELSKQVRKTRGPVYLTVNGHEDTVLLNHAEYQQMRAKLELYQALAIAEEDIRAGRTTPADEVHDSIRKKLESMRNENV